MLTNADCTIIENAGTAGNFFAAAKHYISDVYCNDSRGRTLAKTGAQVSDSVVVYLYSDEYVPKAGDIILVGKTDFVFDSSTPKAASESIKLFREKYPGFAVVRSVDNCMFGGLPHIEITAR